MPAAHLPVPPRCYAIAPEERAALCHKAASYCAKLLKRVDQCQAVLACSHLHWQPEKEVGGWAGEDILWVQGSLRVEGCCRFDTNVTEAVALCCAQ